MLPPEVVIDGAGFADFGTAEFEDSDWFLPAIPATASAGNSSRIVASTDALVHLSDLDAAPDSAYEAFAYKAKADGGSSRINYLTNGQCARKCQESENCEFFSVGENRCYLLNTEMKKLNRDTKYTVYRLKHGEHSQQQQAVSVLPPTATVAAAAAAFVGGGRRGRRHGEARRGDGTVTAEVWLRLVRVTRDCR